MLNLLSRDPRQFMILLNASIFKYFLNKSGVAQLHHHLLSCQLIDIISEGFIRYCSCNTSKTPLSSNIL
jgi:hypothetical protein